jgi:hypothetical protein
MYSYFSKKLSGSFDEAVKKIRDGFKPVTVLRLKCSGEKGLRDMINKGVIYGSRG